MKLSREMEPFNGVTSHLFGQKNELHLTSEKTIC